MPFMKPNIFSGIVTFLLIAAAAFMASFESTAGKSPPTGTSGVKPAVAAEEVLSLVKSPWLASIDEPTGLPLLSKGGKNALRSSFVFWGNNWKWAGIDTQLAINAPYDYRLTGVSKPLDLFLNAQINKATDRQLVWQLDFDARSASRDVIGGGIAFFFDLAGFRSVMGDPELLPGNRGWVWGKEGGSRIEMRFEPALAALYFERGRKEEIRAFFYSGNIPKGKRHYKASLSLSGDMAIQPSLSERFGIEDISAWPEDTLDWNSSPVDLSFLNAQEKPAGKRGFVKARGDQLVFEDGTPARFWGTNLTAAALFGTPGEAVRQQARRLSALGFNLVRIHHHDSPWVNPNIFGQNPENTLSLDPDSLNRLDWWIKCLKEEGIYVWLDLHVQRAFKPGDGIYAFDEIAKGSDKADLKGYNYVNLTMQQAMKRFNEAYLTHVNAYTNLAYKDEPAIAALLITNENDITHHFGNSLLPDKNIPLHNKIYMNEAKAFASKHGLPEDQTWRSWEAGPSKLFLNDLEQRFNADMIGHLRALGVKAPIATTSSWGLDPLFSLPALTAGDIVDIHSYGGTLELEKNPLLAANMIHWMAAGQVTGKPMTVTEWNVEKFPVPDRHGAPLYVAANARLQGWDALMQYAYSQVPLNGPGTPSNWHAYNDPALIATLPAAALLYRQGHAREAGTSYVYQPGKEQLFYEATSPNSSVALRTAAEKGKLLIALPETPELPWLKPGIPPSGARIIRDPDQPLIDPGASTAISDTGELRRDWKLGIYTIDTPRTKAATGWVGSEKIMLPGVEISAQTRNATIAVQSLDGVPIGQSRDIMISLAARSVPSPDGKVPFRSEPVTGQINISAREGLKLYKRDALGGFVEIPVNYVGGSYRIILDKSLQTHWLFLKR